MATKTKTAKTSDDDVTLRLIADVKARKVEIAKAEGRPDFKTNMSFSYSDGKTSDNINLNTQSSMKVLVGIVAYLKTFEQNWDNAARLLGVEDPPKAVWAGYSVDDWVSDIKTRVTKVQLVEKRKKLEALEARLDVLISPELRRQMELEAIANELS